MDVKSTEGDFNETFYVTSDQINAFAAADISQIYRVYQLNQSTPKFNRSENIKSPFSNILKKINEVLPEEVQAENMKVKPNYLKWIQTSDKI